MMDRYWQSGAVPDAPAVPASNAGGYPANGNPAAGINGTVPGEWWYYAISEELRNVIVSLGGTPDYTQVNQLAAVLANEFAQTTQNIMGQLAKVATTGQYGDLLGRPALAVVATSGQYHDLAGLPNLATVATSGDYNDLIDKPAIPAEYALPPATTSTPGGVIAGAGTTIAPNGTLAAALRTVCTQQPDSTGNVTVQAQNAQGPTSAQVSIINQSGATSGAILLKLLQADIGIALTDAYGSIIVANAPATTESIGGVKPGTGLTVEADGTLNAGATGTTILNLTAAASVTLDLTPLSQGAPEILFNLPIAASTNCALTIANAPASGTLAEFVLVVHNAASSAVIWPSSIHWPQGIAPSLSGAAGKLDTFVIYTQDGGSTYYGFVAGQNQ
ncbi:hypothetical protein [Paraburkholderia adhaesiva]|uniref:hypothetical protein n=1 Tax=Paraburkholderia adhaesiva TaxID=2883244 RepID=UPI001F1C1165|nr:hypothetical protein [Paraburkholderia adhaesiva]